MIQSEKLKAHAKRLRLYNIANRMDSILHHAQAVSYTHLDVYKRQGNGPSCTGSSEVEIQFEQRKYDTFFSQENIISVSYTHLMA